MRPGSRAPGHGTHSIKAAPMAEGVAGIAAAAAFVRYFRLQRRLALEIRRDLPASLDRSRRALVWQRAGRGCGGRRSPRAPRTRPTSSAPWPARRRRSRASTRRPSAAPERRPGGLRASARGAARPSGRRQQVGLLVRAVPLRVPVLPEAGQQARQARSPSWRSTPRTRARRRRSSCEEFPVPYPSFFDPDSDIAELPRARRGTSRRRPSTTARASSSTRSRAATPPRRRWRTTSRDTRIARCARARDNPRSCASRVDRGIACAAFAAGLLPGRGRPAQQARRARSCSRSTLDLTINPASGGLGRRRRSTTPKTTTAPTS